MPNTIKNYSIITAAILVVVSPFSIMAQTAPVVANALGEVIDNWGLNENEWRTLPIEDLLNRAQSVGGKELLQQSAENGDVKAMVLVGTSYMVGGRGVRINNRTAVMWFSRASEANFPLGMAMLAQMYLKGLGVEKDAAQAAVLTEKAANLGNLISIKNLAQMYENGIGVSKNLETARLWYLKGVSMQDPLIMNDFGLFLAFGDQAIQNQPEAATWFAKSAELGNQRANINLGWLYRKGWGVEKNEQKTIELWKIAAQSRSSSSDIATKLLGDEYRIYCRRRGDAIVCP